MGGGSLTLYFGRFTPGNETCSEGWMGPRVGQDVYGKYCLHRDSISGPSRPSFPYYFSYLLFIYLFWNVLLSLFLLKYNKTLCTGKTILVFFSVVCYRNLYCVSQSKRVQLPKWGFFKEYTEICIYSSLSWTSIIWSRKIRSWKFSF